MRIKIYLKKTAKGMEHRAAYICKMKDLTCEIAKFCVRGTLKTGSLPYMRIKHMGRHDAREEKRCVNANVLHRNTDFGVFFDVCRCAREAIWTQKGPKNQSET